MYTNMSKYYKKLHKRSKSQKKVVFYSEKPPEGARHSHVGIFSQEIGSIGSVVLIPEENIVLISEESDGFMAITEKLINYKENWKLRFSPKMQVHL